MYLATQFGLDAGTSAALSIAPWAVNIACTNLGGYLGDKVCALSCTRLHTFCASQRIRAFSSQCTGCITYLVMKSRN